MVKPIRMEAFQVECHLPIDNEDKSTGKSNQIITNEKGRLPQSEVDIRVQEDKLKDTLEAGDKEATAKAGQRALQVLDENRFAEKDEPEAEQKDVEGEVNPIMIQIIQATDGSDDISDNLFNPSTHTNSHPLSPTIRPPLDLSALFPICYLLLRMDVSHFVRPMAWRPRSQGAAYNIPPSPVGDRLTVPAYPPPV